MTNTQNNLADKKIFTKKWILFGTYIGGPLAAGFFLGKNFEIMEQKENAKNTYLVALIVSVILFSAVVLLPDSIIKNIPNSVIPLAYTLFVASFYKNKQEEFVKDYISKGGAKRSGWTILGIAILSLIISMTFSYAVLFIGLNKDLFS